MPNETNGFVISPQRTSVILLSLHASPYILARNLNIEVSSRRSSSDSQFGLQYFFFILEWNKQKCQSIQVDNCRLTVWSPLCLGVNLWLDQAAHCHRCRHLVVWRFYISPWDRVVDIKTEGEHWWQWSEQNEEEKASLWNPSGSFPLLSDGRKERKTTSSWTLLPRLYLSANDGIVHWHVEAKCIGERRHLSAERCLGERARSRDSSHPFCAGGSFVSIEQWTHRWWMKF